MRGGRRAAANERGSRMGRREGQRLSRPHLDCDTHLDCGVSKALQVGRHGLTLGAPHPRATHN